jgi:hypothetical protein
VVHGISALNQRLIPCLVMDILNYGIGGNKSSATTVHASDLSLYN